MNNSGLVSNSSLFDYPGIIIILILAYVILTVWLYLRVNNFATVTRIYSTIHSLITVTTGGLYLYYNSPIAYTLLVYNSISYSIYDTLVITGGYWSLKIEPLMILHHLAFVAGLNYFAYMYPTYVAMCLLTETSTIFLNWSWYLYKTGQTKTAIFKLAIGLVLASYIVFRIMALTFLTYQVLFIDGCVVCTVFTSGLLVMNVHWFKKLIAKAIETTT